MNWLVNWLVNWEKQKIENCFFFIGKVVHRKFELTSQLTSKLNELTSQLTGKLRKNKKLKIVFFYWKGSTQKIWID